MLLIPFAIKTATGEIVSIDDVERGLRCGCHCPSCEARLVARKGEENAHNFAHIAGSKQDCTYSFETSIRLMLLAKLGMVTTLNTPQHNIYFDGGLHWVADGRSEIQVQYVQKSATQSAPTGLYQLVEQGDYRLAVHLPAAHDPDDWSPIWLGQFIAANPKTGILAVRYSQFRVHMLEESRPADMDTISWMLSILCEHSDCLRWMYHPREEKVWETLLLIVEQRRREEEVQEALRQQEEKEREERRLREEQEREVLRQREAEVRAARLKQQEIERQQREEELKRRRAQTSALLADENARNEAGQSPERSSGQGYRRERSGITGRGMVKPAAPSQPRLPLCKHCCLPTENLCRDGFCDRQFCTNARRHIAGTALARRQNDTSQERHIQPPVEVVTFRPVQVPVEQEPRIVLERCPKCGGEKGKGEFGWWCEECN